MVLMFVSNPDHVQIQGALRPQHNRFPASKEFYNRHMSMMSQFRPQRPDSRPAGTMGNSRAYKYAAQQDRLY